MKFVSQKLSLAIASVALVLVGCTKKPTRPDPGRTVLGQGPGGPGGNYQQPISMPVDTGIPTLTERPTGFDPNGLDRESLKAQAVYFDFDHSNIKASEREKLKIAKDYLDKNPTYRLLLEGRCDWRGTTEYNLGLGDRRANAAKKYLQSLGVPLERLETISKGSLEAAKNGNDATMAKDRRVDLVVVNPAAAAPAAF